MSVLNTLATIFHKTYIYIYYVYYIGLFTISETATKNRGVSQVR